MSSYLVIEAVSKALKRILWDEFNADDVTRPIVGAEEAIVFRNPTETARDSANRLSLWLYQITENEFAKNQPPVRSNGPESASFPPLALNLFYLVTPFAPSGEADHILLGKTMQVLYDNAVVLLREMQVPPEDRYAEELRIIFSRLTLEELTRVWEALREPYRLSVCYQIRITRIDSLRMPSTARVVQFDSGYRGPPLDVLPPRDLAGAAL
jgi:hypothetical protein